MKDKYIKFFKREIIFLLILLVVVCFSFGVTYSNFIYNSEEHRAVEMFTSALDYEVTINNEVTNKIIVKPGNNLVKLSIKSLNNIDSFFKIIYSNKDIDTAYFNNKTSNRINKNDSINMTILIFNKKDVNETVNIKILGGFATNKLSDIKIPEYYYEINKNIVIGEEYTFNNNKFKLLNVESDGSFEFISNIISNTTINGSLGYNKYISTINNSLDEVNGSTYYKAVNLEDIEKYLTNKNVINYSGDTTINNAYYPVLWGYEKGSVINGEDTNGIITRSEEFDIVDNFNISNITIKSSNIEPLSFVYTVYKEILTDSDYFIATRCNSVNDGKALFEVLTMNNGNINKSLLYDSDNVSYEVSNNIRAILRMPNSYNLLSSEI